MSAFEPALIEAARVSAAWPFEEAKKLVARLQKSGKQEVVFETGYGPSGLPHIGTFGEVARTSMVRHAFQVLTDGAIPTRLIAFSDDMDGLRKVPDNVPNKELLAQHLGKPLTEVPDPFGTHDSFGRHNNARLCAFLDQFGFDYEFKSSTDAYRAGEFDATLLKMLARFDKIMSIMLATLREERAATYSPFLPIHPKTRIVMQVPIEARDVAAGTITWTDPQSGERFTTPVTGGHAKLQWKPDWAMRWVALGVDYEMAGKDLIDSVKVSSQIARAIDGTPPEGFNYELFLDEQGQKISKSKGNGLTIEDWLSYGPPESLALFMYSRPREAKKLHFDVIPRAVDDYLQFLGGYDRQDWKNRLGNPVWHIHAGTPPQPEVGRHRRGRQCGAYADLVLAADEPRRRREFRGQGRALGLPAALCARHLAADASAARCAGRLRPGLLQRLREAGQALSPCRRDRTRRLHRARRRARHVAGGCGRRSRAGRSARRGARHPALPEPRGQECDT